MAETSGVTAGLRVVVLTGAGVSTGSGLRPFRGPGALYDDEVVALVSADNLPGSLPALWGFIDDRRLELATAEPNAAHRAIADAQRAVREAGGELLCATQNGDGLHQRAGTDAVAELHGSFLRSRCLDDGCSSEPFDEAEPHDPDARCPACGSPQRPDVVLFGEVPDAHASWVTKRALRDVDLFVAAGTSGMVAPANGLVANAKFGGARTVLVNLEDHDDPHPDFDERHLGRAEDLLPDLLPCLLATTARHP